MFKKNFVLILILLLAAFLRFNRLDYLELFGDEIDAGYQAYSLLETGHDYKGNFLPLYAQSFSEWRAPMMMYFMTPFIKVFGLNEIGVRSFAAFFGVVSLLGFYFLLRKIKIDKRVALISLFLISIAPWHIQYSRTAFEITLMSSFILWGLYFLIDYLDKNKFYKLFLSALLLSLSFYTYNTANVYVPLLIVLILGIRFFTEKKKGDFKGIFKLLLIMFLFSLPILYQIFFGQASERFGKVSLFNHESSLTEIINYREQQNNSLSSKVFYNRYLLSAKKIGANYLNAFSSDFLFGRGDVTFRHSLQKVGNFFWIYSIFILIGLIFFFKKKNKKFFDYFMLGFLLISPIPSSLTIDGAYHASRLFLVIFPLSYFAALGLNEIFKFKRIVGILCVLILFFEFSYFQHYYWKSYRLDSWRWWHFGYKELMQSVDEVDENYSKVYFESAYEPAYPKFLFWNEVDPYKVFNVDDNPMPNAVKEYEGFCYKKNCFLRMGKMINSKEFEKDILYILAHPINVGGDWDWSKNPPEELKVLKTIKNPLGENLFYLVEKSE